MVAKQLTVFSRQNQLLQNRLRFPFSFLCLLSQKEKVEFLLVPYEITVSKVKYTFTDFKLSLQKQDKA